jgi:hypothetical protein
MESVISSVAAGTPSPAAYAESGFSARAALLDTKLGLASLSAVACFLIGVAVEPPFLLEKSDDPMKEARVSFLYAGVLSLAVGLAVLAFPSGAARTSLTGQPPQQLVYVVPPTAAAAAGPGAVGQVIPTAAV